MFTAPFIEFEPQFNPDAKIQARLIGAERQPLLLIDDLMLNAGSLVEYASAFGRFARPPRGSMYPGLNAPLPPRMLPSLVPSLRGLLDEVFATQGFGNLAGEGFFGLTVDGLDDLSLMQRTPHHDSDDPRNLAMVYYLCAAPYGGTGFFRHQASGFEYVDRRRGPRYSALVEDELKVKAALPAAYVGATAPHYDQIAQVEAVFNRLIIYRTTSLHCALLNGAETSADPKVGRLTANMFLGPG